MLCLAKSERAHLEWLAVRVVDIHMHASRFRKLSVVSREYKEEREATKAEATRAINLCDRGFITDEEAISIICRLAD